VQSLVLLEAELAAGELDQPLALSGLLGDLGLHFMRDVRRLNDPEQLELVESLKTAGVNLGSRSKLRLLASVNANMRAAVDFDQGLVMATVAKPHRRKAQDQPLTAATSKADSGGFSVETLAIMVTTLLGLASYILQAKLARDANHSEKEHDRRVANRDKEQRQATLKLDRVRSQLADALFPISNNMTVAARLQVNLQWELKLPIAKPLLLHKSFIRPLAILPHLEVFNHRIPNWSGIPLEAYGPDDLAELAADASKRDVFVATYRHSIVPRMRAVADIWVGQRHLLDFPSPASLDGSFAASGIDWNNFLNGAVANLAFQYAQHADTWAPIMCMWEREEFSIMFPKHPLYSNCLGMAVMTMIGTAGQEEQKLLGVSAGSDIRAWLSRDVKDSEQSGRQDDST
jgi:hypothetical protein